MRPNPVGMSGWIRNDVLQFSGDDKVAYEQSEELKRCVGLGGWVDWLQLEDTVVNVNNKSFGCTKKTDGDKVEVIVSLGRYCKLEKTKKQQKRVENVDLQQKFGREKPKQTTDTRFDVVVRSFVDWLCDVIASREARGQHSYESANKVHAQGTKNDKSCTRNDNGQTKSTKW